MNLYNWFEISGNIWNNSFSYDKRKWRYLYVPELINWILSNLKVWNNIVFEEVSDSSEIQSYTWLEKFIETNWNWIPTYIFDNHNHCFYFWVKSLTDDIIQKNSTLIHIDEHTDMREAELNTDYGFIMNWLWKEDNKELLKLAAFRYTNQILNVWNYIKPALECWIFSEVISITWEDSLDNFNSQILEKNNIVLNLDMDFFSPWMNYFSYEKKKRFITSIAKKSKLITIATSPFFIDQETAIKIIKDIFS